MGDMITSFIFWRASILYTCNHVAVFETDCGLVGNWKKGSLTCRSESKWVTSPGLCLHWLGLGANECIICVRCTISQLLVRRASLLSVSYHPWGLEVKELLYSSNFNLKVWMKTELLVDNLIKELYVARVTAILLVQLRLTGHQQPGPVYNFK